MELLVRQANIGGIMGMGYFRGLVAMNYIVKWLLEGFDEMICNYLKSFWSPRMDLNRQPADYKFVPFFMQTADR
jgi:hypothetical protein